MRHLIPTVLLALLCSASVKAQYTAITPLPILPGATHTICATSFPPGAGQLEVVIWFYGTGGAYKKVTLTPDAPCADFVVPVNCTGVLVSERPNPNDSGTWILTYYPAL